MVSNTKQLENSSVFIICVVLEGVRWREYANNCNLVFNVNVNDLMAQCGMLDDFGGRKKTEACAAVQY